MGARHAVLPELRDTGRRVSPLLRWLWNPGHPGATCAVPGLARRRAVRGPFDSAPLRLAVADAQPAGSVSVAESPPGEQAAAAPAPPACPSPGCPRNWPRPGLPRPPGSRSLIPGPTTKWPTRGPPTGPARPLAGTVATSVTSPPNWFDTVSPAGHPQADGMPGAAPAMASRRAALGSSRRAAWSGHRMTITAMVVTLALVGTAGIAAWQVSQLHAQPDAVATGVHRPDNGLAAGTGHPGSTQPAAHGRPAPLPRASRSAAPAAARAARRPPRSGTGWWPSARRPRAGRRCATWWRC